MISRLRGTLLKKTPTFVILDVGGVGYGLYVPLTVFYHLPNEGETVELSVYTYLQKDGITLFGFLSDDQRELFELLISVRGIGPKVAMTLLSGMEAGEVKEALLKGDKGRLQKVPGIGRRLVERMIFELKEKLASRPKETLAYDETFEDALAALVRLGYPKGEAKKVLQQVLRQRGKVSLEDLLKEALRCLYGKP